MSTLASADRPLTRRHFLQLIGLGASLSLLGACAPAPSPPATSAPAPTAPPAQPAPAIGTGQAPPAAAPQAPAAGVSTGLKRVTIAWGVEVPSWNPYAQSGSTGYATWMNIYETLVRLDFDRENRGTIIPALAERWETPDGKTWTFSLRKGVTFSDGTPFTAADVVYSYDRIMNDPDSLQSGQLKSYFSSMEAADPNTFRIVLKGPNGVFLDEVRKFVIMSKARFEKLGGKEAADKQPLGTGPYLFKEWTQGQHFVLTRNPSYWGAKPDAEEVVIRPIGEEIGRITALNNGEADIITSVSPHLISQISSRSRAAAVPGERHMFIPMRPDTPPTDNKLVRQAIYLAIDRQTIVDKVLDGYANVLRGPLQTFCIGYDPNLPDYYPYNPSKAKELLAQAGLAGGVALDFPVATGNYVKAKEVGQTIVAMLKEVGITANMQTPESATFNNDVAAGKYGFYFTGRGNTLDPSAYLTQFFRTGSSKRVGYSDPEVDKLIDSQQATTNEEERKRLLGEAQRKIMEDAPAVFLFTYKDVYGVANNLDWAPWPNEYIHAYLIKAKS